MSYAPATDFLALIRQTAGGARLAEMPGLDWLLAALARAGFITLWTSASSAPVGQPTTVWLRTSASSWATEGGVYLWNALTQSYEPATPLLWAALFQSLMTSAAEVDATASETLSISQSGQLFTNTGAPEIVYTLPVASLSPGAVFEFIMGQAGALNVLLQSGDALQWGLNSTTIGADASDIGSYLKVRSINGQWFVIGAEGTWALS
jgi:hypothetical protein